MGIYSLTLGDRQVDVDVSDVARIAALQSEFVRHNDRLKPDTERESHPDYCVDDRAYLQWVMRSWLVNNPEATNQDITETVARATASYAGQAPPALIVPLSVVKSELKQQIDAAAEVARLRYITGGSGQAMEYIEVAKEARNYALDPLPQPAEYPMLWASVEAGEAADLAAAVALIRNREAAGVIVGAAIRKKRIAGKLAVTAATTVEEAHAAAQIVW